MSLKDVIKNVLLEELNETAPVGGGATGASMAADPTGVQAQAPGNSKKQGDAASKALSDGVTGVEDTDPENNVNTASVGDAAKNAATIAAKEHMELMFDGEELSEEFKDKASTLFEAALHLTLTEAIQELDALYEAKLVEEVQALEEQTTLQIAELVEQLDKYLNYVAEEWVKENEIAIQSSLRSEVTEDFINGLKNLFVEHYIDIPEEKVDVVEELSNRVQELEEALNEKFNENIELVNLFNEKVSDEIFSEVAEGLAATQIEKLKTLSEGVEFNDVDTFKNKLNVIKETYFPSNTVRKTSRLLEESFDGEEPKVTTGPMAQYMNAIARTTVK